ncbi:N-acetyltransferase family protein [Meridianimarinicoccus sp. RP-17]|uniref:GNAT family N-acetyltransferase n=1 Tax=Meridianimarinicoccus zhengii TaxID=2056810 RepID=UPI0013A6B561|nr:GNAT family N-acetyltransferase [Phycocomes zhengii]
MQQRPETGTAPIHVRPYREEDAPVLARIFDRAVREGAASAYDATQRAAWAGAIDAPPEWCQRLSEEITLVAERDGQMAGFMTLGRDGFLDLAFVLPEAMGTGVAAALHDRVLAEAESRGLFRLTTEASHIARRFFIKQGWREMGEIQVDLGGTTLTSFSMEKRLRGAGVRRS